MEQIIETLSQLYKILNCKMALVCGSELYCYPQDIEVGFEADEVLTAKTGSLKGYSLSYIEGTSEHMIFCVESSGNVSEASIALAALFLKAELAKAAGLNQSIIRLLEGGCIFSDIAEVNRVIEDELYVVVLSGIAFKDYRNELLEIVKNSLNIRALLEYQGNMVMLAAEANIIDACSGLHKNIITEIFIDPTLAIGGRLMYPEQLKELYSNCIEAVILKKSFNLNNDLLDYESMLVYRLIASMTSELKKVIKDSIFTSKFTELLNNEIESTIEEMFKNNLNLTDTSARLYVHRNTLLYRIEKIHKLTGYDLRKFEDSMLFQLAWYIYKENKVY